MVLALTVQPVCASDITWLRLAFVSHEGHMAALNCTELQWHVYYSGSDSSTCAFEADVMFSNGTIVWLHLRFILHTICKFVRIPRLHRQPQA